MKKTLFAGLSVLEPGEPLSDDNGAFTGRDPETTDRFLELGAKTHRHSGLSGLANPSTTPLVSIIASGGALPPSTAITLGFTLEDEDRGETMLSPTKAISTPGAIEAPTNVPAAVVSTSAGSLLVNTYYYAVTFVDGEGGETPIGPAATAQRQPGFEHSQVELSGLNTGMVAAGATGWRLYRAVGGAAYNLLASGTGAGFIDDGTHSLDCSTHPPTGSTNTTHGTSQLKVVVPLAPPGTAFVNVYASVTGDFSGGSRLGRFPAASAGETTFFTTLELGTEQPPPVNRSVGTAHQIDPDTELLEWHWKRPVTHKIFLPTEGNQVGDVRLVEDENSLYGWIGGSWESIVGGGGGSLPRATLAVFGQGDHPGLDSAVVDAFGASAVSPEWEMAFASGLASASWHQEEGHLRGAPGGLMYRNDAEFESGNGQIVAKVHYEGDIFVNFELALVNPVEGEEDESILFQLSNANDLSIFGNGTFLESETFTPKLKENTDYWFRVTKLGAELVLEVFEHDPSEGGGAKRTLRYTLDADVPLQAALASRPRWFGGLGYGGPTEEPGGYFDEWRAEARSTTYVEDVELLEMHGLELHELAPGHIVVTASGGGGGGGGAISVTDGTTTVSDATSLLVTASGVAVVAVSEPTSGHAKLLIEVEEGKTGEGFDVFKEGATPGHPAEEIKISDSFPGSEFDSHWTIAQEGGGNPTEFWTISGGAIHNTSGCPLLRTDAKAEDAEMIVHYNKQASPFFFTYAIFSMADGTRIQCGWADGENHFRIGTESEEWAHEAFTEVAETDYWIKATKEGKKLTAELWTSDPTLGGSPVVSIEHELEEGEEGQAKFIGQELFGGVFAAGAPGGEIFDFTWEGSVAEEAGSEEYVKHASKLEFAGPLTLEAGGAGIAKVTLASGSGITILGSGIASATEGEEDNWTITVPPPAPPHSRTWASAAPVSITASGSANFTLELPEPQAALLKLSTNHKARVRVYGDEAARTADAARAIGTEPTGDHGVQLDYANNLEAGGGRRRLTPAVLAANLDEPAQKKLYLRVTNLEATTQEITVAFLYLPLEA